MKFFKQKPQKGQPISVNGFAEGIAKIAFALENMRVQDGQVQWLGGVPLIVLDGETSRVTEDAVVPNGTAEYQVLRWDATAGAWIADWVRASPDAA